MYGGGPGLVYAFEYGQARPPKVDAAPSHRGIIPGYTGHDYAANQWPSTRPSTDDLQLPQWSHAPPWPYGRPASYHRRKRPALEEEEEEERGRATWPSSDGRRREEAEEEEARVLRPVGSADDLEVAFEASCHRLSAMRLEDDLDPAKARFIGQSVSFIFTMLGERFICPAYLDLLARASVEESPSPPAFSSKRMRAGLRPLLHLLGGRGMIMEQDDGELRRRGAESWVKEIVDTPGAPALVMTLARPDGRGEELVKCNSLMSSEFISAAELLQIAAQCKTVYPVVLARLMPRESNRAFYHMFMQFFARKQAGMRHDGGEGSAVVQLRNRRSRLIRCLATMRWHWGEDRVVIACRFWSMAGLLGGCDDEEEAAAAWLEEEEEESAAAAQEEAKRSVPACPTLGEPPPRAPVQPPQQQQPDRKAVPPPVPRPAHQQPPQYAPAPQPDYPNEEQPLYVPPLPPNPAIQQAGAAAAGYLISRPSPTPTWPAMPPEAGAVVAYLTSQPSPTPMPPSHHYQLHHQQQPTPQASARALPCAPSQLSSPPVPPPQLHHHPPPPRGPPTPLFPAPSADAISSARVPVPVPPRGVSLEGSGWCSIVSVREEGRPMQLVGGTGWIEAVTTVVPVGQEEDRGPLQHQIQQQQAQGQQQEAWPPQGLQGRAEYYSPPPGREVEEAGDEEEVSLGSLDFLDDILD